MKIFCLYFSILLLIGCGGGRNVNYDLENGDLKLTITKDYIIVDSCEGTNGFDQPFWIFNRTISRSDSVACRKLLESVLKK